MNQRSNKINQMPHPTPRERTATAPDRGGPALGACGSNHEISSP